MKIIFLTHPDFLGHQSMPRFTKMLADGMQNRGYEVETWAPKAKFFKLSGNKSTRKWLGYIDQFIIFPKQIRNKIEKSGDGVIYVLTDQALGPWVPLIKNKAHVVHCHDFLAQFSALGDIKQNPTSLTGKIYQKFIWRGYSQAKNFISVSQKTKNDLLHILKTQPQLCEVVYNGLNQLFTTGNFQHSRSLLGKKISIPLNNGFVLHVGGNQWYKNRSGVIDIYNSWRNISQKQVPLLLIGEKPSSALIQQRLASDYKESIFFLDKISDENIRLAYHGATVLLFPSIAEGFGWPIAEAMASGCLVITTDQKPMLEVAGDAGFLIPVMPEMAEDRILWSNEGADKIELIINLTSTENENAVKAGIRNAKRFETDAAIDKIEKIYIKVLDNYQRK